MTADIANIDVREIDTGTVPTRFARGWHCLGVAKSYRDGRPHSVQAFGTKCIKPGMVQSACSLRDRSIRRGYLILATSYR
jgi:hypothetical protein